MKTIIFLSTGLESALPVSSADATCNPAVRGVPPSSCEIAFILEIIVL